MLQEDDVKQLIVQNTRRLQILKETKARDGFSADPKIQLEIEDIEAEIRNLEGEQQRLEHLIRENPYRGLAAFQEDDADVFFGRDKFTKLLIEAVKQKPLTPLIGPSGSGKSSIVFAGLIPNLRRNPNEGWVTTSFRPGPQPFAALATALLPLLEPDMSEVDKVIESRKLTEALKTGQVNLHEIAGQVVKKTPRGKRLLLVADQFEELYTLCHEDGVRQQFQNTLLQTIDASQTHKELLLSVLLSLRADFLGTALAHRAFADALQEDIKLGPMTREELSQAIIEPANKHGVSFESGLVERILNDVGDEAGNLPLLEFALTSLWDRQKQGKLTHQAYEAIGGVTGALTNHAEAVYARLPESEQERVRRVLLQMVQPGETAIDTRRITSRAELGDQNWSLTRRLADERLVVTNRDLEGHETAEVIHEALIRNWQQLKSWIDADRGFRAWQERLRASLRQWEISDKDEGALLRGAPLAEAENWIAERELDLSQAERVYIQAGIDLRHQEEAKREQQRRQRIKALSIGLGASVIVTLIVVALAIMAWSNGTKAQAAAEQAEKEEQTASNRGLMAQAASYASDQLDLAMLLSLEGSAGEEANSFEARHSLLTGLASNPLLDRYLRGHAADVNAVAYSTDGKLLASGGDDNTIILWNLETGQPMLLTGHTDAIYSLAFRPDGKMLASGGADKKVILWDTEDGKPRGEPLAEHTEAVLSLAFSRDGKTLASGSQDKTIILWDTDERVALGEPLQGHDKSVTTLAFGLDGHFLASGSADKTIIIWDVADRNKLTRLFGHTDGINSLDFHPKNGLFLASGSRDKKIIIWNWLLTHPIVEQLSGHDNTILDVAFSPDGSILASTGWDKQIILWDMATYSYLFSLTGHTEPVRSLAFSLANESDLTLASGSDDDTVILWDLSGHRLSEPLNESSAAVLSVAVSQDGRFMVSGGDDDAIILWDIETPDKPKLLNQLEDQDDVLSLAFSPFKSDSGRYLASGSANGVVTLREINDKAEIEPIEELTGHGDQPVTSIAFNFDGRLMASADQNGVIIVWDVGQRTQAAKLTDHTEAVNNIAFSPAEGSSLLVSGSCSETDKELCKKGELRLWDGNTGQPIGAAISAHNGAVRSLAFNSDGSILASGSSDGSIIFWNVVGNRIEQRGEPNNETSTGTVTALAFSADDATLASSSDDNTVALWTVSDGTRNDALLTGHVGDVNSIAFGKNNVLISGSSDGKLILWNLEERQSLLAEPLAGHRAKIRSLAYSPDGEALAAGTTENAVILWDIEKKEQLAKLTEHADWVNSVAFSPDGDRLASGGGDNAVILWELTDDGAKSTFKSTDDHSEPVTSVAFSPDGETLASASRDKTIILWDLTTDDPEPTQLRGHSEGVNEVVFSPDGQWLASAGEDGLVFLWNMETHQVERELNGHNGGVSSVAFSPDSQVLASGSDDTDIILWEVATGKRIGETLADHTSWIGDLVFSPDGRMLASSGGDNTIILWDITTRQPLAPPLTGYGPGYGADIQALAFHDQQLASGNDNGAIVLWNLDSNRWRERACEVAGRNLTWAEWSQFLGDSKPYHDTCPDVDLYFSQKVIQADTYAQTGDKEQAGQAFAEVVEAAQDTESAEFNNVVCRYGSLDGFAEIVLPACEEAVDLASEDEDETQVGRYQDSRGVALALNDQPDQAIEDFGAFIDWATEKKRPQREVALRQKWIDDLKANRNPFDPDTLVNLRPN